MIFLFFGKKAAKKKGKANKPAKSLIFPVIIPGNLFFKKKSLRSKTPSENRNPNENNFSCFIGLPF